MFTSHFWKGWDSHRYANSNWQRFIPPTCSLRPLSATSIFFSAKTAVRKEVSRGNERAWLLVDRFVFFFSSRFNVSCYEGTLNRNAAQPWGHTSESFESLRQWNSVAILLDCRYLALPSLFSPLYESTLVFRKIWMFEVEEKINRRMSIEK